MLGCNHDVVSEQRINSAYDAQRKRGAMEATVVIHIQLPEDVYRTLQARGVFPDILSDHVRCLLAMRFYQERILSLGQATRLAGLSRWDFIEYLSANRIPVLDFTQEELAAEFTAVDRLVEELNL